jgi:hypothetical protein
MHTKLKTPLDRIPSHVLDSVANDVQPVLRFLAILEKERSRFLSAVSRLVASEASSRFSVGNREWQLALLTLPDLFERNTGRTLHSLRVPAARIFFINSDSDWREFPDLRRAELDNIPRWAAIQGGDGPSGIPEATQYLLDLEGEELPF